LPSRATTTAFIPPVSVAKTSSTVAAPSTAPSGGCIAFATSSCSTSGFVNTRSSNARSCSEPITSASDSHSPSRTTGSCEMPYRCVHRGAAGAAGENALFAREPARPAERLTVRDADPVVHDLGIHRLWPGVLADAFDEVRVQVFVALRRVHRAFRVGTDDEDVRLSLLEVAADAADRAARADRHDDRVDLAAAGLLPDLTPLARVVT